MEIHLQVGTYERQLSFELMGNPSSLAPGATVKIGGGAELRYEAETFAKVVSVPTVIDLVLSVGKDVLVGFVSAWLYDRLMGGKTVQLFINGGEVEVTREAIGRALKRALVEREVLGVLKARHSSPVAQMVGRSGRSHVGLAV